MFCNLNKIKSIKFKGGYKTGCSVRFEGMIKEEFQKNVER